MYLNHILEKYASFMLRMDTCKGGKVMDPIKQLHEMLEKENIPHKYIVEKNNMELDLWDINMYGERAKYMRNQIMYPTLGDDCRFDAIWQYGSYGPDDRVETYHELGCSEDSDIRIMTVNEAFDIIYRDWIKNHPGTTLLNGEPMKEDR